VRELILVYILGLLMVTLFPERTSMTTFLSVSEPIQLKMDERSPVLAAEKDLITYLTHSETKIQSELQNLNQQKKPVPVVPQQKLADYSVHLQDIQSKLNTQLVGPIQLNQGLALTGDDRLEVYREHNGLILERGDIDISSGTYNILLEKMEGSLCAKLTGDRYEVMGRGCVALSGLQNMSRSLSRGPLLNISKYQDVVAISEQFVEDKRSNLISSYESKELPMVETQKYKPSMAYKVYDYYDSENSEPRVIENTVVSNSVDGAEDESSYIITQIAAAGYVPTRVIGGAGVARRGAPQQRKSAAEALNTIAKDAGYTEGETMSRAVVWGRLNKEGQTIAGATVSIEGREELKPLYFNELHIPDVNQKVTASHGIYAIMNVPDGEYALRAEVSNKFIGFQNASARAGSLSLADIDSTFRKREVSISTYDLVTKVSQSSVVTLQAHEEDLILANGQVDVLLNEFRDNSFALVNPINRNYLTTQFLLEPGQNEYSLPLVHKDWMEALLSQAKLKSAIQGRIVMGLGPQEPFKAFAVGSEKAQVIYFDSNAQIVEGAFGPAGGGFLIIDPEEHVVEYAIQKATQKNLRVVYMPTQPGVLSVIR
jgi:hypothetical protein